MNADISYNSRVANQASLHKAKINEQLRDLAALAGAEYPEHLDYSGIEAQLSENNNWLALQVRKLELIIESAKAAKTAAAV